MGDFTKKKCVPCTASQPALSMEQIKPLHGELGLGWALLDNKKLKKDYSFKNYKSALAFVNDTAKIAEEENHHPDIFLTWGKVSIEIFTHKIDGLSENDFILAAKIDALFTSDTGMTS